MKFACSSSWGWFQESQLCEVVSTSLDFGLEELALNDFQGYQNMLLWLKASFPKNIAIFDWILIFDINDQNLKWSFAFIYIFEV